MNFAGLILTKVLFQQVTKMSVEELFPYLNRAQQGHFLLEPIRGIEIKLTKTDPFEWPLRRPCIDAVR